MNKFINVGHRGAAAYVHENTVASLEEAISRRADMIEFDIRMTADGKIVLFHDWSVRTVNGRRRSISKITFDELSESARNRGYELATFEDVLARFGQRIPLNIEIKVGGFESKVLDLLQKYPPAFTPTLSSFFPWVVGRIKRFDGSLKTALILGQERVIRANILARPVLQQLVWALGINSIHLQETIVSASVAENLSRMGVTLFVWTVDDPDKMRKFLNIGVDGIITNRPDILYNTCLEVASTDKPILHQIVNECGRFAYAL